MQSQADIELTNVESTLPLMRSLERNEEMYNEEKIETDFGTILVAQQGADYKLRKPVIITYHDIGLNHVTNFQAFFNFMDMKLLLQSFCVFHINAPGQEDNAPPLPDNYVYPTMDQLAQQIGVVCKYYGIKSFIGFGVGAGANILCRFALVNPDSVDGLFLINPAAGQSSWTEWLYQKLNVYYLGAITSNAFPQSTQEYLMWHHFGKMAQTERNKDLVNVYRNYFTGKSMNARSLSLFIDSFIKRTDLGIDRNNKNKNFKCSVLVLCGAFSPHVDDTVQMNGRLDPSNSTWMKLSDCGMVLEEQPGKVAEALKLFLQGLGYALTAYERRRSSLRQMSTSTTDSFNGHSGKNSFEEEEQINDKQKVHIVENPIENAAFAKSIE